jgi:aminoglycoside phosphotransferase (APT) family kinase protein
VHDDEVRVDLPLVRALVDGQCPRWADEPLVRLPSTGTDNLLFRLGEEWVVRLPKIHWAADDAAREGDRLARVAGRLPVAVPEQVAVGEPAHGYPWSWSVCRWIDGEEVVPGSLAAPAVLATDLGAAVQALRGLPAGSAPAAGRGEPLADRDGGTREALAAAWTMIDGPAAQRAWDESLAAPPWEGRPAWLHGDLMPGNLLLSDGRLGAVLDWAGAGVGDPACDLMAAWWVLPANVRNGFRAAAGADEAMWRRGRGWALSTALVALPYYHRRHPPLAEAARRTIAEVLADPGVSGS